MRGQRQRIVVAMSGGVDSSVVAAMLAEQGHEVIGITMQLYDQGAAASTVRRGSCCAGQDIYDARRVAEHLGVPHYVVDYESRFSSSVIDDFADSYMRGETPLPCVKCNQDLKFGHLLQAAKDLGADAMATGHYVRRVEGERGAEMHMAADERKDQSYFLFATTRDQLEFLRFPLGDMRKADTRALAARYGLPVAEKPDSQDICFVPDGDYAAVVSRLRPSAAQAGDIVDETGKVLGRHDGTINFTIGQRRGLNVGFRAGEANAPLYVVRIEPDSRRVVVGNRDALAASVVRLRDVNWLGDAPPPPEGLDVSVRLRSSQIPAGATFFKDEGGGGIIRLREPVFGVAAGQAGVIYQGTRVLGGGWICGQEKT